MNLLTCIVLLIYSCLLFFNLTSAQWQLRAGSYGRTKRVLRRYKVCSGARCESLKTLSSPFTGLLGLGGENMDFLHYGRWTRWSPCSRHCSTRRYRACRFPLSCGTTIIHEEAFCYRRGTHCELIYQSSLGDFFAEDEQQYNEDDHINELAGYGHGYNPPTSEMHTPIHSSSEWIPDPSEFDLIASVARVSKKKIRRQPKRYGPFLEEAKGKGRRKIKPPRARADRDRPQVQNNTTAAASPPPAPVIYHVERPQDEPRRRNYLGLDALNNYEYNGPFPIHIDDYTDERERDREPNYNYNYNYDGFSPFLPSNANGGSNEEEFTCGIAKTSPSSRSYGLARRILGGSEAQKGRWPWQVAILNRMQEAFCGGTLIAPRWILTAAHCVRRRIYVTIGEHHLHRNDETEKHYRIEAAFIHPDFETDTVDSDIALLLLPEPVPTQLGLACLPFENQPLPSPSTVCTILGWGKQKYNHVFGTHALHEGKVPIVSNGECRYAYGQYEITSNMFCAGYSGGTVDSCAGDSGGPLLCTDDDNRWTVHGVTSFGDGCGRKGKFGIYAKVSNYVAWIKKVMQVNMY